MKLHLGSLLLASWCATRLASAEPFYAFLDPDTSFVEVDSTFTVVFAVGDPAEHFNGYEVTLQFDPSVVEFEAVTQGSLMTQACPNRFAFPTSTDSTVTYSHVLLCAGVYVSGPGELSRYRFRALANGVSPLSIISDPNCTFFENGLCINGGSNPPRDVTFTDGTIVVGTTVAAPVPEVSGARLQFSPNPTAGSGTFRFSLPQAANVQLEIFDAVGRRVGGWNLGSARTGSAFWDGSDASGRRMPSGVYFARLRLAGRTLEEKVVIRR